MDHFQLYFLKGDKVTQPIATKQAMYYNSQENTMMTHNLTEVGTIVL